MVLLLALFPFICLVALTWWTSMPEFILGDVEEGGVFSYGWHLLVFERWSPLDLLRILWLFALLYEHVSNLVYLFRHEERDWVLRSIQSSSALISWPCGSWRHSQLQLLNGFLGEGLLLIEEYFWINIVDEGKLANCIDQLYRRWNVL